MTVLEYHRNCELFVRKTFFEHVGNGFPQGNSLFFDNHAMKMGMYMLVPDIHACLSLIGRDSFGQQDCRHVVNLNRRISVLDEVVLSYERLNPGRLIYGYRSW